MYSINGINLDSNVYGWRLLRGGSQAVTGITKELTTVKAPGYDGYFRAPSTRSEQVIIFNMKTSLVHAEKLFALLGSPNLTIRRSDSSAREAIAELVSAIPSGEYPSDREIYITVTLNVFGAAWRDVSATTSVTPVTGPTTTINLLPGISAPVRDMDVFLSGVFNQFTLVDSGGSWLKSTAAWPGSASTGMLYIGSTGQTFVANTSAPWTPVSDAGHLVDVSGGGGFKITPELVGGDPSNRRGRLTLTTLAQTSTNISVRAKGAYTMQGA